MQHPRYPIETAGGKTRRKGLQFEEWSTLQEWQNISWVRNLNLKTGFYTVHSSPIVGHSGYHKTLQRATADFIWSGMKRDIKQFITECDSYQRNKTQNLNPAGLLQPLPLPTRIWSDISMNFIEGLSNSNGYNLIIIICLISL